MTGPIIGGAPHLHIFVLFRSGFHVVGGVVNVIVKICVLDEYRLADINFKFLDVCVR